MLNAVLEKVKGLTADPVLRKVTWNAGVHCAVKVKSDVPIVYEVLAAVDVAPLLHPLNV